MMITDSQRLRICRALARRARHEHVIGEERPTADLAALVDEPTTASTSEWLLLQLAHAVWSGATGPGPTVGLMLLCLNAQDLHLVGRLLQAFAAPTDRDLEAWLTAAGFPRLAVVP